MTITNPNLEKTVAREIDAVLADLAENPDFLNKKGAIKVRRLTKYDDPQRFDRAFESVVHEVQTNIVNIDAKIYEGSRVRHYTDAGDYLQSPTVQKRLREAQTLGHIGKDEIKLAEKKSLAFRMSGRQLQEGSDFEYGLYPDEARSSGKYFPISDVALPSLNSPQSKNALLIDYLDAHRKCLVFNTLVPLLDGSHKTLQQLAEEGGEHWVYAVRPDGMVSPALAHSARKTGDLPVVTVRLDNDECVTATADHRFMLRDGTYRDAGDLQPGDSLMPLYRKKNKASGRGPRYEQVYHPGLGLWEWTHRLVARTFDPDKFFAHEGRDHVDHINEVATDNRPENLQVMLPPDHLRKTVSSDRHKQRSREYWLGKPKSAATKLAIGVANQATWADPVKRANREAGLKSSDSRAKVSAASLAHWATLTPEDRTARSQRLWAKRRANATTNNHKVVSVTPAGVAPVYDLTVPDFNNFAVGKQGVFVHNSWEAATFNPIAKRISKIIPQFVLGRGVKGHINSSEHQKAWDDFAKRNRMRPRTKQGLRELIIYGEIFWRFFETKAGLIVRSIDPSTIWDIVTNDDDIEDVKYYHQQYTRFDVSPLPGRMPIPSTLVIRQIPADQVSHYKINATSSEKRGRSELFPILGYLLRLKEFVNDRILLNKMRAMFALDVAVTGGPAEVAAAETQFAEPPGSASVLVHNAGIEVDFKNTSANATDATTDADIILKVIAIGAGVSADFLGVSRAQTRAGALISTEPDVKNFEDYQELIEEILMETADRVFQQKRLPLSSMEFTFPSIAQEDRSAKLKDIAFSEAMDWIAKERAAAMGAREFQITDYNYADEKRRIEMERAQNPVIAQGLQQMPKVATDPAAVPSLGADLKPSNGDGVTQTSAQMGFKDDGGGRGLPNTRATLNRTAFTRGGEKTALANNRTSGTPLRHAGGEAPVKHGWSDSARERSLAIRRARAEQRKREQNPS